jgi:hypothetical protein
VSVFSLRSCEISSGQALCDVHSNHHHPSFN